MKIRGHWNAKSLKFYYTSFKSFSNKSARIFSSEQLLYNKVDFGASDFEDAVLLQIEVKQKMLGRSQQRSARSSHRPRNDRGMSKNSSPRSRLDLGLSLILVSSLVSVSKKVKNPRNSSFFPRNDRGMRKKSSPRSRLDLGLGQANSLELDLGLEKGALADLWFRVQCLYHVILRVWYSLVF